MQKNAILYAKNKKDILQYTINLGKSCFGLILGLLMLL